MSTKTASSMNGLAAPPTNAEFAQRLDTVGDLLEAQGANRFRYQAYQRAAEMLQHLEQPAWQIYESHGIEGLHTVRGDRHYTALFSNTARAHEMGTTHDWVVIYLEEHQQGGQNGRWTVITSQFGKLRGRRIVRGRERECAEYYEQRSD